MKLLYRAVFGLVIAAVLAVGFFVPPTAHAAQTGSQQPTMLLTDASVGTGQAQIVLATSHPALASQPRQNFATPLCAPVRAPDASFSSGVSPSFCGDIACINVVIVGLKATGTNTFSFGVTLTNNCNVTITQGTLKVSSQVSCPASIYQASASAYAALRVPWNSGTKQSFIDSGTGWCEGCTNHIPDWWPIFRDTVFATVAATDARNNSYINTGNPSSTVQLNNSSTYSIPC